MLLMRLTVNGEEETFQLGERTVQALVRHLGFVPEHVVVECNGTVYKGTDSQAEINDGDILEIVRFVGGGSSVANVDGDSLCEPSLISIV